MFTMRARIAPAGTNELTAKRQSIPKEYTRVNPKSKSGLTLTVDGGVTGTGLALWSNDDWSEPAYPIWCGNINPGSGPKEFESRVYRICCGLTRFLEDWSIWGDSGLAYGPIERAYLEIPKFFSDKAAGTMVAQTGDLVKLAYVCGAIGYAIQQENIKLVHVRVDEWKGQMSKAVVTERIKKRLPRIVNRLNPKSHSWDSIGIGLWAKGYLTLHGR